MRIEIGKAVKLLRDDVGFIAYDDDDIPVVRVMNYGGVAVVIGTTVYGQYVLRMEDDEHFEIFAVVGGHIIEEIK